MTVPTALYFLFLALLSFARAIPNNCAYKYYGDLTGVPVELNTIHLSPTVVTWHIIITNACDVVGVMMKVCDPDTVEPPLVNIQSMSEAIIKRMDGSLVHDAVLYTTVYCKSSTATMNSVDAIPKDMGMKRVNYNNNVWA